MLFPSEKTTEFVEKDDASSSHLDIDPSPPPYFPPSGSNHTYPPLSFPAWSRANLLYISQRNKGIRGQWTIDPTLQVPEALKPTVSTSERINNLHFETHNDNIHADLALVSDTPSPCRTYLLAKSRNGTVTIRIVRCMEPKLEVSDVYLISKAHRLNQIIHLEASSVNDNVKIYIPRDFCGPVTFKSDKKTLKFSDAVLQRVTQIGTQAFIGNLNESGFDNPTEWLGDELDLVTQGGYAKIWFNDEDPPRSRFAELFRVEWD